MPKVTQGPARSNSGEATVALKYWAFISYSHQDNRTGGNLWGDWLHDAVENFQVPAELAGKAGRGGEAVPQRLFPVFQDEKELPTNADLGGAIQQALEQSRYLIVICSPRAAKSVYVNQEVLEFKRLGRANRILAIIIDGEPNASEPGKGLDPALECFPRSLRYPLDASGNLDLSGRAEPIAADVRDPAGKEPFLKDKAHRPVLEREKLRVVAGLMGIGFDDLVQRDKERQLRQERARARRLRKLAVAFAALAAIATLAGVLAFVQKREADKQRQEADTQKGLAMAQKLEAVRQQREVQLAFSKADCAAALERVGNDQPQEAVAFLCRALRTNPENRDAAALLFSVISTSDWVVPMGRLDLGPDEEFLALDANGRHALTRLGTTVRLWDLDARQVIREMHDLTFGWVPPTFSPDGRSLILPMSNSLQKLDIASGRMSPLGMGKLEYDWFSEGFRFSPDGQRIALSNNGGIQAWGLAGDQPVGDSVRQPANEYDRLPSAISRDGSRIVYPWVGGPVTLWDGSGKVISRNFERQPRDSGEELRIWDVATGKPLPGGVPYPQTRINFAAFSPDGKRLMAATMDDIPNIYNTLRIWSTGEADTISIPHDTGISGASWSADGHYILTASRNVVRIWDSATGELAAEPLYAPDDVLDTWFSPDGSRIIAATIERAGVDLSGEPGLREFALNPNGRTKSSFYKVKSVMTWDAALARSAVASFHCDQWVLDARFSPNGRWVAIASGNTAQVWDVAQRVAKASIPMDDVIVSLAFSSDSQRLLVVSQDGTARVWEPASGQPVSPPIRDPAEIDYAQEHNNRGVSSIGFAAPRHPDRNLRGGISLDGKLVAMATGFGARVWDAATGKPLTAPLRHADFVNTVCFSFDGRTLLTAGLDAEVRLWDVATGKPIGQPIHPNGALRTAAFSRDGEFVATAASDLAVRVWSARTGQAVTPEIRPGEAVKFIEFSPEGKALVTLSGTSARVWDARSGRAISAPMRHNAALTSAMFSPDARYVLTASEDHLARVWSAATGLPVSVPLAHDVAVNVASFSADGRTIVSADEDGTVKLWPFDSALPPAWALDFAEALAGCSLDATGTPSHIPGRPPDWLRLQAESGNEKSDLLVNWARKMLRVK